MSVLVVDTVTDFGRDFREIAPLSRMTHQEFMTTIITL